MSRYSEAKLRGIKLTDLYRELPTHPTQRYNRIVSEYKAEKYWKAYQEREEMWLNVFLDEPEARKKEDLKFLPEIP